ncbi:MAG: outer membrane protein assembly factor BamE [Eubacteriales bacterium]|nr:outer membrane protein assembly factor BamE [Eubacteriales bacterium]
MDNQFHSNDGDQTVIIPQNAYGEMPPQMTSQGFAQVPQNNMYGGMPNQQMPQNNMYGGMPNQQMPQNNMYGVASPKPANNHTKPPKKKTGLIVGIIIAAVVIICGILAAIFAPKMIEKKDKKAAQKPVEQFFEGYQRQDLDYAYEAFLPDIRKSFMTSALASAGVSTNDEFWDQKTDVFGEPFEIEYEITKVKKDSAPEEIEEYLDDEYDCDVSIKKIYVFSLTETYSGPNGSIVMEETVYSGKVDGDWYIVAAVTDRLVSNDVQTPTTEAPTTEEPTTEAATTEAPTTEAPTTETNVPVAPAGGFDWTNMQFSLDGIDYNLGNMTYADVEAMGFAVDATLLDQEIEEYNYTTSERAYRSDDAWIYVRLKNFTGTGAKKARDCDIYSLEFCSDSRSNLYSVVLGNGVAFGMSKEEVYAIMGTPSYEYISDDGSYISIDYEQSDAAYTKMVSMSFSNNVLDTITLVNPD